MIKEKSYICDFKFKLLNDMLEKEFYDWLITKRTENNDVASLRKSNCLRVCEFEGDLDVHFEKDECRSLIENLTYSTDDERNDRPTKHKIPIDGNKRTGTATFKQAVRLYVKFKNDMKNGVHLERSQPIEKKDKSTTQKTSKHKKQVIIFNKLQHHFFSHSVGINSEIEAVINCFQKNFDTIKSPENKLKSNDVLKIVSTDLKELGFKVEESKKEKIKVPILDNDNQIVKYFEADAVSADGKILLEVEAGRAFANNQFLKDVFQACMMQGVDFLIIAVRNQYKNSNDFLKTYQYFETLYIDERFKLPLKGIVLIGY